MTTHNVECDVYERLRGTDVVPLPKVWYTQKLTSDSSLPGVIIMEDLSGVAICGRYEAGVTLEQVRSTSHLNKLPSIVNVLPEKSP